MGPYNVLILVSIYIYIGSLWYNIYVGTLCPNTPRTYWKFVSFQHNRGFKIPGKQQGKKNVHPNIIIIILGVYY